MWQDDLKKTQAKAWSVLKDASEGRLGALRHVPFATVTQENTPSQRILVLRDCNPDQWSLEFHTDRRSGKISQLNFNPYVSVLIWHAEDQIQIRAEGEVTRHAETPEFWPKLGSEGRAVYQAETPPGTKIDLPEDAQLDASLCEFCRLTLHVTMLETVYLGKTGHRRARFCKNDSVKTTWLVP